MDILGMPNDITGILTWESRRIKVGHETISTETEMKVISHKRKDVSTLHQRTKSPVEITEGSCDVNFTMLTLQDKRL